MGKKPKLLDGADWEGESGANRVVGPMIGAKSLDAAPLVDGAKGLGYASTVLFAR